MNDAVGTVQISPDEELLMFAERAMTRAYCPASHFAVGAAVRTIGNLIFLGCNIENASYGLSICAERVSLFKAVSEGHTELTALAVVANSDPLPTPCGACRQVLQELAPNASIHVRSLKTGETKVFTSAELLPEPFTLENLPPPEGEKA